jgi:hypothetical protein
VVLAGRLVESASAYLRFMREAAAIDSRFSGGGDVAREVRVGSSYQPAQFEEGVIAYGALLALQDPAFVDGVRAAYAGRGAQSLAAALLVDPAFVRHLPGAEGAARRASLGLRRSGERLMAAGARVKQAAYDVQRAAWSKSGVVQPEARLARAKSLSAVRTASPPEETERLLKTVLSEEAGTTTAWRPVSSAVLDRALALAALAAVGEAGRDRMTALGPLVSSASGSECLKMAKLNLFQCLAVAGPHYEDIFCLGRHAMMDTAQCVIGAAGGVPGASASLQTRSFTPEPEGSEPERSGPESFGVVERAADERGER